MEWFTDAAKAPFDDAAASRTTPGAVATVYAGLAVLVMALLGR